MYISIQKWLNIQLFMLVLLLLGLPGCAQQSPNLEGLIRDHELHRGSVTAGSFQMMTLEKTTPGDFQALHIYIGGDGEPWGAAQPSVDPTGKNPVAVALIARDTGPSMYLGRPCYYQRHMPEQCAPILWSAGRYSETVVAAMASAVEKLVTRRGVTELTLIGYSGGGVLALLVAQRLSAVSMVVTIAANLDIERWAEFHGFAALHGSLNPLDIVPSRPPFRQVHLIAQRDLVVPSATISRYVERHPGANYIYYPGFDHRCCWVQHWEDILGDIGLEL